MNKNILVLLTLGIVASSSAMLPPYCYDKGFRVATVPAVQPAKPTTVQQLQQERQMYRGVSVVLTATLFATPVRHKALQVFSKPLVRKAMIATGGGSAFQTKRKTDRIEEVLTTQRQ